MCLGEIERVGVLWEREKGRVGVCVRERKKEWKLVSVCVCEL